MVTVAASNAVAIITTAVSGALAADYAGTTAGCQLLVTGPPTQRKRKLKRGLGGDGGWGVWMCLPAKKTE